MKNFIADMVPLAGIALGLGFALGFVFYCFTALTINL